MKKAHLLVLMLAAAAAVAVGVAFLLSHWPSCFTYLNGVGLHGNIERLRAFILSFGIWAPLISAFLMIGQSVILFLPAFPIFVVNALVYGPVWGTLLSWGSAVGGSLLCFGVAKILGRPVVQRLVSRVHLQAADGALRKYEKYVILVFGFIPVISFDVISYASGLTLLTFWEFVPLVCIAQVPSTLFYTLFVHRIDRGALDVYWVIAAALFFLLGFASLLFRGYLHRNRKEAVSLE